MGKQEKWVWAGQSRTELMGREAGGGPWARLTGNECTGFQKMEDCTLVARALPCAGWKLRKLWEEGS